MAPKHCPTSKDCCSFHITQQSVPAQVKTHFSTWTWTVDRSTYAKYHSVWSFKHSNCHSHEGALICHQMYIFPVISIKCQWVKIRDKLCSVCVQHKSYLKVCVIILDNNILKWNLQTNDSNASLSSNLLSLLTHSFLLYYLCNANKGCIYDKVTVSID